MAVDVELVPWHVGGGYFTNKDPHEDHRIEVVLFADVVYVECDCGQWTFV